MKDIRSQVFVGLNLTDYGHMGNINIWENNIEISRFLDNDSISIDTIKSVIYHEYLHQKYAEHDSSFKKKETSFLM